MADIDKVLPNVEQTITIPPEEEIIAMEHHDVQLFSAARSSEDHLPKVFGARW